jgi:predicted N-acetyltransferase YhbS
MNTEWQIFLEENMAIEQKKHPLFSPEPVPVTLSCGQPLLLRPETEADYRGTETMTRRAFWGKFPDRIKTLGGIGCDEHYLCHVLRRSPEFLPELDFVAEQDGRIAGNIMYSLAYVRSTDGKRHPVLLLAPLSVSPEQQKTGIGGALLRHTLSLAKELGYGAVALLGHPSYYPRFGFVEAKEYGITLPSGETFPAFMTLELTPGALSGIGGGTLYYSPRMELAPADAREYDKTFPPMPTETSF